MRRRWFVLILLALGVMISFIDRTSISSALATPVFKRYFGLSDVDRGWVSSAFFWSYAILQVPLGWVVDRYGVKRPYAICFAFWCAATAGIGFVGSLSGLIVLRLIVGAAGVIWLVPWLLVVRDDSRRVTRTAPQTPPLPARRLLASPLIWGTLVVNFCYNYFTFYCMTWMPSYLVEQRGLGIQRMGLYAFFSFAGIAVVALAAGWAADRLIRRGHDAVLVRKSFTIAGFSLASSVVLSARADTVGMALFWNVASLSALGLATANYNALCRITLIPASIVGLVTGFQQVATAVAGIVAPVLTGWLLHVYGNYDLAIDAIFVFLVIGALTTAFLLRRRWSLNIESH